MPTKTILDISTEAEKAILNSVRTSHLKTVDAVTAGVSRVEKYVPKGPKVSLPKSVPTSQVIVDDAFAFTIKLVEAQRGFAADLLNAISPVLRKATGHAPAAPKAKSKSATAA
jgi:hypothetical protein